MNRMSYVKKLIFFSFIKGWIISKAFYKEPLNRYIVYSFLEGTAFCKLGHKRSVLCKLVKEVINKYEVATEIDGWGWKENLVQSWNEFLTTNVMEAHENVRRYISEEAYRTVLS